MNSGRVNAGPGRGGGVRTSRDGGTAQKKVMVDPDSMTVDMEGTVQ
jgi:hypothetical protein